MRRMERRMYRRARGQAMIRRVLLGAAAIVIIAGLAGRRNGAQVMTAQPLSAPTSTPVAAAFDETVETREVTLAAETWYAIQTGVYSTRDAAEAYVNAYADRGAPGYIAQDGGKWRVFIACYGEKSDASTVRERLASAQNVETYLFEWTGEPLRLRLTGMIGQLDVVEAGLSLRRQTASQLRDDAALLDSGNVTAEEERRSIQSLDDQVTLWADTARDRFPRPYPALVDALLAWADDWQAAAAELERTEDPTALSALLKGRAMALHAADIAFRAEMNAQ